MTSLDLYSCRCGLTLCSAPDTEAPCCSAVLYMPIGPPACGKSLLAARLSQIEVITPSAIVSTDRFRWEMTDSAADQSATAMAFKLAHSVAQERYARGLDVYFDATNLEPKRLVDALSWGAAIVCILFDVSYDELCERNRNRAEPVPLAAMERMFERYMLLDIEQLPGDVVQASDLLD